MQLKNYEIYDADFALGDLVNEKLTGRFKFKLFKNKKALEQAVPLIVQTLEGVSDEDERKEILNEEQDISIDLFTLDELADLPLSIKQLGALEAITKGDDE